MNIPSLLQNLKTKPLLNPLKWWEIAHLERRAGVMLILSPSRSVAEPGKEELDVLLTVRSGNLSYAGDAALPGGKAECGETPWETALRETHEEIGIESDTLVPVTTLPAYVSSKLLLVVPSIAWSPNTPRAFVKSKMEVHKIFNMPISSFLKAENHSYLERKLPSGGKLNISYFRVLATNKKVGDPIYDSIWGLTANILTDCARVLYDRSAEFEFHRGNHPSVDPKTIGNLKIIESLAAKGTLQTPPKRKLL